MAFDADEMDRRFALLEAALRRQPELEREFITSRREFFHGAWRPDELEGDEQARRRHLEWFLLERASPNLRSLAVEHLFETDAEEAGLAEPGFLAMLLSSRPGVFEVTGVDAGQGMWMRDILSQGEYPVLEPQLSSVVASGDLIAGRIFPLEGGLHQVSRAAAFFRNPKLLEALRRDFERAREGKRGLLRLSQREIEGMFYADGPGVSRTDAISDARTLLRTAGIDAEQVEEWLAMLASHPFDPEQLVAGAHDALAEILDRLAFDTALDLEVARRTLIHAWHELSTLGPGRGTSLTPRAPRPAAPDIERALEDFETKRRRGAPIDALLSELEQELALDEEAEEVEESPAPDFPGVVGAMIDEFTWETGRVEGEHAAEELAPLASFARFAQYVGVFENLGSEDLLRYTCWWLLENDVLANADQARGLIGALTRFCRWAEAEQDVPLYTSFRAALAGLESSLPRIVEANRRKTRTTDAAQGELYEVIGTSRGTIDVRDRSGGEHHVEIDPDLADWLKPGDRLRARRSDDGRLAVYCCYPPEASALSPSH